MPEGVMEGVGGDTISSFFSSSLQTSRDNDVVVVKLWLNPQGTCQNSSQIFPSLPLVLLNQSIFN